MTDYRSFLAAKQISDPPTGLTDGIVLSSFLFDFQRDIVRWALRRGRAAIFADCGMGKTPMQLEWARHIPGRVLILTPLAVAEQTVREGAKFGIPVTYARQDPGPDARIVVTNYEMLEHFDPSAFTGVVLDESSILKSYDGKTRSRIIESFANVPYRLACTATPAPNDYMELGNHAEFLGVMGYSQMLSLFFVHDSGETQKWRLKGHADDDFWRWLCSWAVLVRKPSDLGYQDGSFVLPALHMHDAVIETSGDEAHTLSERLRARRDTIEDRVGTTARLVNETPGPWIVWCNLNDESKELARAIPGAVEVRGSDKPEHKARAMLDFAAGTIRVLVTKPTIAGFGMNWQHCHQVAFVGLSDSYEQFYQAVRRCWRFGQASPVNVHVVTASIEGAVVDNIKRKEADAQRMADSMVQHMTDLNAAEIRGAARAAAPYETDVRSDESGAWTMQLGDCVDGLRAQPAESVHYSMFSPPFASLYTYSNSDRDMGNSRTHEEFFEHFRYAIRELLRVTMSGRLCSFHCMNLPTSKIRHGVIGLTDFRGELIRLFQSEGWIYHSEVLIWKNPVTAMQRTKALGLLHKQLRKDSAMSRQGIPDYLVTMRKPGENPERVAHAPEDFPVSLWQRYASPVWMDINQSETLNGRAAREHRDERHICPLQLEVIRRAIDLWSNPGDLVLSPFAGIGSEGVVALEMGRRFLGIELKRTYFEMATANLAAATRGTPVTPITPITRANGVEGWFEGFAEPAEKAVA